MRSINLTYLALVAALVLAAACSDDTDSGTTGDADTGTVSRGDTGTSTTTDTGTGGTLDLSVSDTSVAVDTGAGVDTGGTATRVCSAYLQPTCEGTSTYYCVDTNGNGTADDGVDEVNENDCTITNSTCDSGINYCLAPANGACLGVNSVTRDFGDAACSAGQGCHVNWSAGSFNCEEAADLADCTASGFTVTCEGSRLVNLCDANSRPGYTDCATLGEGATCDAAASTCRGPAGAPCSVDVPGLGLACLDGLTCEGESDTSFGTCTAPG